MQIITPEYADEAVQRLRAGEDFETVWESSPHRPLTVDDLGEPEPRSIDDELSREEEEIEAAERQLEDEERMRHEQQAEL